MRYIVPFAFFGLVLLAFVFRRRRLRALAVTRPSEVWKTTPGGPYSLVITDDEIACEHPKRPREAIRWDDIVAIHLVTTSDGPWQPDMWFLFEGESGGCSVPNEAKGIESLWAVFKERFPGIDYQEIIQAGTSDRQRLIWKREASMPSRSPSDANAPLPRSRSGTCPDDCSGLSDGTADPIIVATGKGTLGLMLIGCIVFGAILVWLLVDSGSKVGILVAAPGYLLVLLFGFYGFYLVSRLVSRKPALIIDKQGIMDNASMVAAGFIPWSDFVEARIFTFRGIKYLGISVHNPQEYLDRAFILKRLLMRANRPVAGTIITIPQSTVPVPFEQLLKHINCCAKMLGGRECAELR